MNSFHPGAHASAYYGDGNGRDYGIIRSSTQLCGTSDAGCVATSKPIGLPTLPPPIETARGHPPGYTGHVPGANDSYGETYALRTARFNSPREDGSRRDPPNLTRFSTSSSVIGAEKEQLVNNTVEPTPMPILALSERKTAEEREADAMLAQNPPRAIAPRSVRYSTNSGFSEVQIDLVRRLDMLAESNTEVLAQLADLIIINIPNAARALQISEERLRGTALSIPTARMIREDQQHGSYSGVAVSQQKWDGALNCANSS